MPTTQKDREAVLKVLHNTLSVQLVDLIPDIMAEKEDGFYRLSNDPDPSDISAAALTQTIQAMIDVSIEKKLAEIFDLVKESK